MEVAMNRLGLESKLKKHWQEWCPQKTKELKEAGIFESEAHARVTMALKEREVLLMQGYRDYEADEVIMKQFILTDPEPEVDEELEELEREYQETERSLALKEREFVRRQEEEEMVAVGLQLDPKEWQAELNRRVEERLP
jgi:hypothetical protein